MTHICMLTKNSVVRDARVLRQAHSLAERGHRVSILGFMDANCRDPETKFENGVCIIRSNHRAALDTAIAAYRASRFDGVAKRIVAIQKYFSFGSAFWRAWHSIFNPILILLPIGLLVACFWLAIETPSPALRVGSIVVASIVIVYQSVLREVNIKLNRILAGGFYSFWRATRFEQLFMRGPKALAAKTRQKLADYVSRELLLQNALFLKPNILHCHDLEPLSGAVAAKKKLKIPLVFDAHEIYEDLAQGSPELSAKYRAIILKHQKSVDHFVTINDSIASFYDAKYRLPKPTIIKNATRLHDPVAYDGRMHDAAQLSREQNILLYQGGFAEKRGLRYLVAASAHLRDDWTLVMMGWGRLEPVLRQLGEEAVAASHDQRATPCIAFIPPAPQAELALWSAGGTVGVIPYERVGLNHLYCTPNKLWEYPAAGVPILCTPLVEMRNVIDEHGIGWLLPEGEDSAEAIAAVVNKLQPSQIDKARAACARYMTVEGWHKYEQRLIDLYTRAGFAPPINDVAFDNNGSERLPMLSRPADNKKC